MTVRDIEWLTGVNKDAVSRYEAGRDILASALKKLERFFRDEGVIFLDADANGGVGVRVPVETTAGRPTLNLRNEPKKIE